MTNNGLIYGFDVSLGSGRFTNTGSITAFYTAVSVGTNGALLNNGFIYGYYTGVAVGSGVSITNSGTIECSGVRGVGVFLGAAGSSLLNSGYVKDVDAREPATVMNFGSIGYFGSIVYGVYLHSGGSVDNRSRGDAIAFIARVEVGGPSAITNYGSIGLVGINGTSAATVTNAGTIGTKGTATAIQFGNRNERLIVDPGAVFLGKVLGGSGSNVLELTKGSSPGHLLGLGTSFTNFGTLVVDPGAQWVLGRANHLVDAGVTVDGGTGLAIKGSLEVSGTVSLTGPGNVRGIGTIAIDAASVLDAGGRLGTEHLQFLAGGHEMLVLHDPAGMSGTITGFGQVPTNTIELAGATATSIRYARGVLSVDGAGGSIAALHFAGGHYYTNQFHFAVAGGSTNITFG